MAGYLAVIHWKPHDWTYQNLRKSGRKKGVSVKMEVTNRKCDKAKGRALHFGVLKMGVPLYTSFAECYWFSKGS